MLAAVFTVFTASEVFAEYARKPESEIDADVFKIDEKKHLGARISPEYLLMDGSGAEFEMRSLRGKPLILVLSYFQCDGFCSVLNDDLKELLKEVSRPIGKSYNVLTLSFDRYDSAQTLKMFAEELALSERLKAGWRLAVMKNPAEIKELTKNIGFKYFWSLEERTFFHPNVYVFISPEGRVTRYLYASTIGVKDVELALAETARNKVSPPEVMDFIVSYCYSYNFKEGRYTYNIPLFVALGSLTLGITSLAVSAFFFKRRKNSGIADS